MAKNESVASKPDTPMPDDAEDASFEVALEQVESAVKKLESGQLSLSDALHTFSEGIRYLRICYRRLDEAEQKIEKLLAVDDQGRAVTEPFTEDMEEGEERAARRRRRRS